MKLSGISAERFVGKPDAGVSGALVYGANYGLGQEYITRLCTAIGGEVTELRAADLLDDPARVHDLAYSASLFGGQNLVWLRDTTDKATDALSELLGAADDSRNFVIIEAGELGPKSRLRGLFEEAEHLAALPCYIEKGADLARTLTDMLKAEGIALTSEAREYLVERAPADRLALRGEVERLVLYVGPGKEGGAKVDLAEAQKCLGDAADADAFDLPWLVFDGRVEETDKALTRLFGETTSGIMIVRMLLGHALKLHAAASRMAAGDSQSTAMGTIRPPIFKNMMGRFGSQLGRWPLPRLTQAIARLHETELKCKSTGYPEEPMVRQLTLLLAAAG